MLQTYANLLHLTNAYQAYRVHIKHDANLLHLTNAYQAY